MAKLLNNQAKKLYHNYPDEVQKYMWSIHKFIKAKCGNINDEWLGSLSMLADNYSIFIQCRDKIKDDGLMILDRFGSAIKHPLIKVQNDAQIQLVKLLQEFGLTPKSVARLNNNEDTEDDSPLSIFLNNEIEKR